MQFEEKGLGCVSRFWWREHYRSGFCEMVAEAARVSDRDSFVWAQTDQLVIKAEPIRPSVITFKKSKNSCTTAAGREEREYVRETALQTPRSAKEGEGEAPGPGGKIPLQSVLKTVVKQVVL